MSPSTHLGPPTNGWKLQTTGCGLPDTGPSPFREFCCCQDLMSHHTGWEQLKSPLNNSAMFTCTGPHAGPFDHFFRVYKSRVHNETGNLFRFAQNILPTFPWFVFSWTSIYYVLIAGDPSIHPSIHPSTGTRLDRGSVLLKQSPGLLGTILDGSPLRHGILEWINHPNKLGLTLLTSEGWQR